MRQWMTMLALTGATAGAPAWAQGQIDNIQASATQVLAGSLVWFSVDWHIQGSSQSRGDNNPVPPEPTDGYQEWITNWFTTDTTTATGISLQMGPLSTSETFSLADGEGASGTWTFGLQFDTPGPVQIDVGGSFSVRQKSSTQTVLSTRHCTTTGSEELGVYLDCSAWSGPSYQELVSESDVGGALNMSSLQITVLAVPEPATTALWLAGLAGLGALGRRRAVSPR